MDFSIAFGLSSGFDLLGALRTLIAFRYKNLAARQVNKAFVYLFYIIGL